MSRPLRMGELVRVARPNKKYAHTKGWEGRLASPAREAGGWWQVRFMSGVSKFHESELEPTG